MIRTGVLTLILGLGFLGPVWGQFAEGGARALALGRAATALPADLWGHHNPATWSSLSGRTVGLFASQGFGLSELRLGALQFAQPMAFGTLSLGARTFGFTDYRETIFNAGVARAFTLGTSRAFHVGIQVRYYTVSIPQYGSTGALGLSIGWQVDVVEGLRVGMAAINLNRPELAEAEELPRTFALGIAYTLHEKALLVLDVHKDVRFPVSVRGGVEFWAVPALALRAGFTTAPTRFTAGVGLRLNQLTADMAAERHEFLGWTPALAVGWQW